MKLSKTPRVTSILPTVTISLCAFSGRFLSCDYFSKFPHRFSACKFGHSNHFTQFVFECSLRSSLILARNCHPAASIPASSPDGFNHSIIFLSAHEDPDDKADALPARLPALFRPRSPWTSISIQYDMCQTVSRPGLFRTPHPTALDAKRSQEANVLTSNSSLCWQFREIRTQEHSVPSKSN